MVTRFVYNGVEELGRIKDLAGNINFYDRSEASSLIEIDLVHPLIGEWKEGDAIAIEVDYEEGNGTKKLETGTHIVDSITTTSSPYILRVGAQAIDYSGNSNDRTVARGNYRIKKVFEEFAEIYKAQGKPLIIATNLEDKDDFVIGTARNEDEIILVKADSYLKLIKEIGHDFGYLITIRFGKLRYHSYKWLRRQTSASTIYLEECKPTPKFIRAKADVYEKAIATPLNSQPLQVFSGISPGKVLSLTGDGFYRDSLTATNRCEGALQVANLPHYRCNLAVEGRGDLQLGDTVDIKGFSSEFENGKYLIFKLDHRLDVNGWMTTIEGYRV